PARTPSDPILLAVAPASRALASSAPSPPARRASRLLQVLEGATMSGQSTESSGAGPHDAAPVQIDGSRGEGGGQILRTSLALAMLTGRPLEMSRIRAGRAKPGLRRQHLACVEAAARLCHAEVRGATVGSQELAFRPGGITG